MGFVRSVICCIYICGSGSCTQNLVPNININVIYNRIFIKCGNGFCVTSSFTITGAVNFVRLIPAFNFCTLTIAGVVAFAGGFVATGFSVGGGSGGSGVFISCTEAENNPLIRSNANAELF
jgi:hypothetical protein